MFICVCWYCFDWFSCVCKGTVNSSISQPVGQSTERSSNPKPQNSLHLFFQTPNPLPSRLNSPGSENVATSERNACASGVCPGDQSRHSLRSPKCARARNHSSGRRGSWKKSMYQEL